MTVRAMKAGAVEFLTKPFRDQELLDAIQQAIERHRVVRQQRAELAALRQRYDALTPRERDVMQRVIAGMLNKQIAAALGTSEITIERHRAGRHPVAWADPASGAGRAAAAAARYRIAGQGSDPGGGRT
jgi:FixJ family two-component response regulator